MSDTRRPVMFAAATRFVLVLALWWVLAEGSLYQWWFALIVALAVVAVSLPLLPPSGRRVRVIPVARFVPHFLWFSMLGGVDVGRRVIGKPLDIEPDFLRLPLHLQPGPARLWLVATISLMPGTLSCHLEEDHLQVHVLDTRQDHEATIRRIETHIAAIFGERAAG